jgi:hypothetical protein
MTARRKFWPALGALAAVTATLSTTPQAFASDGAQVPVHLSGPLQPVAARSASFLQSVYCTSPANCWAVGEIDGATSQLNHVLHWTGKTWSQVAVPSPGGTDDGRSQLNAVRCTSASNCWAVGQYFTKDSAEFNQILRWNGRKWRVTPVPQPAGTATDAFNELFDVACTSAGSCWAAGGYGQSANGVISERNEALHWNGKTWAQIHAPNPGGTSDAQASAIFTIRCASANDCWAAGGYGVLGGQNAVSNEVLHWDGARWGKVIVPNPAGTDPGDDNEIFNLSCTSADSCWAAGLTEKEDASSGLFTSRNELLRWDGKAWHAASVPEPDGTAVESFNELFAVACSSVADCWAVGSTGGQKGKAQAQLNEALHWNGVRWSAVSTPEPAGQQAGGFDELTSVRCISAGNCWGVGEKDHGQDPNLDEILHWTGKRWFLNG